MAISTAEMIKRIRGGQCAVAQLPLVGVIVQKDYTGSIIVLEDDCSDKFVGKPLPLSSTVLDVTWELESIRINYNEALHHIRLGNTVRCYLEDSYEDYFNVEHVVTFDEIINGKWELIKEEYDAEGNPLVG